MSVGNLRAFILDDEPLARSWIRSLLRDEPSVELVGESGAPADAIECIRELEPDVLFLDVQMPVMNGFAVLEALAPSYPRNIIFITAHDEFARHAFDVNAVDYLLKPVERERFHLAVEKVLRSAREHDAAMLEALTRFVRAAGGERPHRLLVREGRNWSYVPVSRIEWIRAAGNYVEIHVDGKTHLYRERLSDLESRLDPLQFARVQRSILVNLEHIAAFTPTASGDYVIVMHDGAQLRLSRRFRDRIPSLAGAL